MQVIFIAKNAHAIQRFLKLCKRKIVRRQLLACFLFFGQNIDCGYTLEPRLPTIYVLSKTVKNINLKLFLMKFSIFTGEKISVYCMGKFS